ncbi:uncharacterized protein N7496_000077 [Penicillium cataractarum]|uniref:Uncharacterized protein n=1 Tax=Penicillium cataractarum TaxID=2100454 RepID=A0A9W9VTS3_9EURO|nr:uncharacterized protein N7496_000077 [Penicillium cataractarum]KAJ5389009.1 hypothetical protein N7496_000077 [Penicillium cataractarum]
MGPAISGIPQPSPERYGGLGQSNCQLVVPRMQRALVLQNYKRQCPHIWMLKQVLWSNIRTPAVLACHERAGQCNGAERSSTGSYPPPDLEVLEAQNTSISNENLASNKLFTKPNQPVTETTLRSVPTKPDVKTVNIVDAGNQPSAKNVKEATTKKKSQLPTGAAAPNNNNAPSKTEPPSKIEPSLKREQASKKETPSKKGTPSKAVPLSETEIPSNTKSPKDINEQESAEANPSPDEEKSQPKSPGGPTEIPLTTDPLSSKHSAHSSDKPSPDTQSDQGQPPPTKPKKYPSPPPTPPRPQLIEIRSPETQDLPTLYRRSLGYTDNTRITRDDPLRPGIFLAFDAKKQKH